ncbi:molybdopterin-synthase adenylyltransferase MoeB [Xinfangfangia sp. D13-10-4-6]|uniref:HesA/MoeB/ThiF family protein n=1 Tax=Pseudogemmobacter hezensis TaxID=2737662 RepID=UPI001553C694|nr:molybdopterin-synthase adenylyltransferase MoeB [Pseudogemmobacter hezensis]NPD16473.1 molybdopterin-synthase adenylyltransferase MoeB [Pseudogemmobacter hezensis]
MIGAAISILILALAWAMGRGLSGLLAACGIWLATLIAVALTGIDRLSASAGTDLRFWLTIGSVILAFQAYRLGLGWLRKKASRTEPAPGPAPDESGPFTKPEVERYARHIFLREIGGQGQQRLKAARVLVVGAGGLGSPVLQYLAGAGVGTIGVIDDDLVEASNLQRQVIHREASLGMPKVFSAEAAMRALNPFIEIRPYHRRLDEGVAGALIADYDLVLDGSDNFATRYLVNRCCAALEKPLISGAMTQWEGQLSLWDPARGGPCYECVFPETPAPGLVPSCAEAGVVAPLPGVIGAMMALEAIKHITQAGEGLMGRLMIHDALYAQTRMIRVKKRKGCAACGG